MVALVFGIGARGSLGLILLVLVLASGLSPHNLLAQGAVGSGVSGVRPSLEEALTLEAAGDLAGASELLRGLLDAEPGSIQALLAYERVLRIEGRIDELLGAIDRLLEVEPGSSLGHQLNLRTLSELDREDELEAAVVDWVEAMPELETPYREAARIWRDRGEVDRAVQVLELGRSRLGRHDALALELGDLALARGDIARAVREWGAAIGADARGFGLVRRRLVAAEDGGAGVVPGLIEELVSGARSPARLRAAVELAIGVGRAGQAESIGSQVLGELDRAERKSFLIDVARRADGANLPGLAYWAYSSLLSEGGEEHLVIRGRLGTLALELGDSLAAREHFLVIEEAYESGSVERRSAVAVRIELIAHEGRIETAAEELRRFRGEYPDAPEIDHLAGILGDILLARGDRAGAARVIAGADGPRSGMVRGRIALEEGDLPSAQMVFLRAASQLGGAEATEAITLVGLLRRLSPVGGALLSEALPLVGEGRVGEALGLLLDGSAELDRGERSALLDFAASLADREGLAGDAESIRRFIVTDLPDRPEAPAALLSLGRSLAGEPGHLDEARSYLERLIVEYPRSALVPQARRELDRLSADGVVGK